MTIAEIQHLVCAEYGTSLIELLSQRRNRAAVESRWVAIWLARHCTAHTLVTIGRAFGNRDHTTIMHALAGVEARRMSDATFAIRTNRLRLAA